MGHGFVTTDRAGNGAGNLLPRDHSEEPQRYQVTVWDMAKGAAAVRFNVPMRVWWGTLAFSPDGKQVVTGSWDPRLAFWDARTGRPAGTLELPHRAQCVAFSPDGKRLAVGFLDTTALVYDLAAALKPSAKE
jgi:hypothetical protein